MPEQYDPLSPHRVDESIERLAHSRQSSSPQPEQAEPDAHLIQAMQHLYDPEYRAYQQALQRVEKRLLEHDVKQHPAPIPLPSRHPLQQQQTYQNRYQGSVRSRSTMEEKRSSGWIRFD